MQTFDGDSQRTALVVDYDPWERWFATDVLAGEGYLVVGASNGASGLRLAQQDRCDVILLDLALPELPGADFLRHLRATEATRDIPVIVLGSPAEGTVRGADGCVPKPLDEFRVISEVRRVLDLPLELTVGPDVVLLDSNLPSRLEGLLGAHPVSRTASIVRLTEQLRTRWSQ